MAPIHFGNGLWPLSDEEQNCCSPNWCHNFLKKLVSDIRRCHQLQRDLVSLTLWQRDLPLDLIGVSAPRPPWHNLGPKLKLWTCLWLQPMMTADAWILGIGKLRVRLVFSRECNVADESVISELWHRPTLEDGGPRFLRVCDRGRGKLFKNSLVYSMNV